MKKIQLNIDNWNITVAQNQKTPSKSYFKITQKDSDNPKSFLLKSTSKFGLEQSNPDIILQGETQWKFQVKDKKRITIEAENERALCSWIYDLSSNLKYSLVELNFTIQAKKALKLKDPNLSFIIPKENECFWIPHLTPNPEDVVGEHVFRNPCMLFENKSYSFGILPDFMNNFAPAPLRQYMHLSESESESELELESESESDNDYTAKFGFCSQKSYGHVFFKRTNKTAFLKKSSNPEHPEHPEQKLKITLYFLLVKGNRNTLLNQISQFTLFRYTREYFRYFYPHWPVDYNKYPIIPSRFDSAPLLQPYKKYIEYSMDRYFNNFNGWCSFELNAKICGGMMMRSFTGGGRGKYFSTTPEELKSIAEGQWQLSYKLLHKWYQNKAIYLILRYLLSFFSPKFPKYIWNTAWFMQIRTAYGLFYWGKQLNRSDYVEKALSMKNLLMNTPNNGYFPAICLPQKSGDVLWINSSKAFEFSDSFHTTDMALALYWLLKFESDLEGNISDETKKRCQDLAEFLLNCQLKSGAVPSYVDKNGKSTDIELQNSAESGSVGMFLLELYEIIPKEEYLESAKKIAQFLEFEIVPINGWVDFESKYSCPMFDRVHPQFKHIPKLGPQNNLCISWAIEMYRLLFITTSERKYLKTGTGLLDYLSLFQQMWSPPFLNAHLIGGFGVMNIDGEWSDIRQACFSRLYLEYYALSHRSDHLIRGIAALHASFPLILNPINKKITPGNFHLVRTKDFGVAYENYGHQGWDAGTVGLTTVDWGIGTSFFAAAYAQLHFGNIIKKFENED
ncbi:MAG: hypothetical protein ACTSYI_07815 [Promethearchaeota archaeon]